MGGIVKHGRVVGHPKLYRLLYGRGPRMDHVFHNLPKVPKRFSRAVSAGDMASFRVYKPGVCVTGSYRHALWFDIKCFCILYVAPKVAGIGAQDDSRSVTTQPAFATSVYGFNPSAARHAQNSFRGL